MNKVCRHIKTDGRKCGSPALRGEYYCYYHHPRRLRAARPVKPRYFLELPLLEHRGAVRAAIAETINALKSGEMDVRLGGSLLYAVQLATSEQQRVSQVKKSSPRYLKIAPLPGCPKIYTTKNSPNDSPNDSKGTTRFLDGNRPSATPTTTVPRPKPPCLQ
jgi:hypothetical protein